MHLPEMTLDLELGWCFNLSIKTFAQTFLSSRIVWRVSQEIFHFTFEPLGDLK
jgi:hypothetical protein